MIKDPNIDLTIPSRKMTKDRLMKLASTVLGQFLEGFTRPAKISLAIDCWTSPNGKSFMGILGYYITKDWKYEEFTLGFPHVDGQHSGDNLSDIILKCLKENNLQNSVLGITADNAANNGTTIQHLQRKTMTECLDDCADRSNIYDPEMMALLQMQHHIPCLTHIIQLVVKALLAELKVNPSNDGVSYKWTDDDQFVTRKRPGTVIVAFEKVRIILWYN